MVLEVEGLGLGPRVYNSSTCFCCFQGFAPLGFAMAHLSFNLEVRAANWFLGANPVYDRPGVNPPYINSPLSKDRISWTLISLQQPFVVTVAASGTTPS